MSKTLDVKRPRRRLQFATGTIGVLNAASMYTCFLTVTSVGHTSGEKKPNLPADQFFSDHEYYVC